MADTRVTRARTRSDISSSLDRRRSSRLRMHASLPRRSTTLAGRTSWRRRSALLEMATKPPVRMRVAMEHQPSASFNESNATAAGMRVARLVNRWFHYRHETTGGSRRQRSVSADGLGDLTVIPCCARAYINNRHSDRAHSPRAKHAGHSHRQPHGFGSS